MGVQLTCPRGHRWETAATESRDTQRICPRCGAPPLAEFTPTASSPNPSPSQVATLAQAASVAVATSVTGIPCYQLLGELGRGGMGVVYKAQHLALKRMVALKMVLSGAHAGSTELTRFRAEAEAVARLQHPNIVQIYEVGEHEGRPYCALEFVPGGGLNQRLCGKPLAPTIAAKLLAALAEGVQHAHEHGIIHRDLKPANVLLGVNDLPKITDFGLAKTLDTPDGPTKSGTVLGTPSYMAPEQALGKIRAIGPATDVYSLGAILYECLTGRPPFRAETSLDTMLQVASQEPVPPQQVNPLVPRDLGTICLKCLRKEPGKRYVSARDLADDLGRFLRHEPIRARPVGPMERASMWAKRRPAWVAAFALVLLLPLASGGIIWKWRQGEQTKLVPEIIKEREVVSAEELTDYASKVRQAAQECREGKFSQAEQTLAECPKRPRDWEWHYLRRLCNWGTQRTLTGFGGPVTQVACGKGRFLAAVAFKSPGVHIVQLGDTPKSDVRFKLGEEAGPVSAVAFNTANQRLATVGPDGFLRIYDLGARKLFTARKHDGPLSCVAFSPDGNWLVVGGGHGRKPGILWLWNGMPGKEPFRKYAHHKNRIVSVAFFPDGKRFASIEQTGQQYIWSISGGQDPSTDVGKDFNVKRLLSVPRSMLLGRLNHGNRVDFWQTTIRRADPPERERTASPGGKVRTQEADDQPDPRPGSMVEDAAFSSDESLLALAGGWPNQGKVRLYRDRYEATVLFLGHSGPIHSISFSPDSSQPFFATGSRDGTVRIWDPTVRRWDVPLKTQLGAGPSPVQPMAFSPNGRYLAMVEKDHETAAVWDLHTGRRSHCPRQADGSFVSLCFSGDSQYLVGVSGNGKRNVSKWSSADGKPLGTPFRDDPMTWGTLARFGTGFVLVSIPRQPGIRLLNESGKVERVLGEESKWLVKDAMSPNGKRLAAIAEKERLLTLWDTETGRVLLTAPASGGKELQFSGNGKYLLLRATEKWEVQAWNAETGQPAGLRFPSNPGRPFPELGQLSGDGRLLALPAEDGKILLWNTATGKEVATLKGHGGDRLAGLAFSANGRRLFTAAHQDAAVKVWDTVIGKPLCELHSSGGKGGPLLLGPDGRCLSCQGSEGVHVWDATPLPEGAAAVPQ